MALGACAWWQGLILPFMECPHPCPLAQGPWAAWHILLEPGTVAAGRMQRAGPRTCARQQGPILLFIEPAWLGGSKETPEGTKARVRELLLPLCISDTLAQPHVGEITTPLQLGRPGLGEVLGWLAEPPRRPRTTLLHGQTLCSGLTGEGYHFPGLQGTACSWVHVLASQSEMASLASRLRGVL